MVNKSNKSNKSIKNSVSNSGSGSSTEPKAAINDASTNTLVKVTKCEMPKTSGTKKLNNKSSANQSVNNDPCVNNDILYMSKLASLTITDKVPNLENNYVNRKEILLGTVCNIAYTALVNSKAGSVEIRNRKDAASRIIPHKEPADVLGRTPIEDESAVKSILISNGTFQIFNNLFTGVTFTYSTVKGDHVNISNKSSKMSLYVNDKGEVYLKGIDIKNNNLINEVSTFILQ